VLAAALLLGAAGFPSRAAEPTAAAVGAGRRRRAASPKARFRIAEKNGVYEGTLVKIFPKPGDDSDFRCDKCEGRRKVQAGPGPGC